MGIGQIIQLVKVTFFFTIYYIFFLPKKSKGTNKRNINNITIIKFIFEVI